MAVEPRSKLTYEDYVHFPDDGLRYELIEGEAFVNPSPNNRHQTIVLELAGEIRNFLKENALGKVFIAPFDVLLSEHDVVEPDVIFIADVDRDVITEANIKGTPTLLIEVLSDAAMDRGRKLELYARRGVPEYWIVDPIEDLVEVYRFANDGYGGPEVLRPGKTLRTDLLPGLEIEVSSLLQR